MTENDYHVGRYLKPGEFCACVVCGVLNKASHLDETSDGVYLCKDLRKCERWKIQRDSGGSNGTRKQGKKTKQG